MLVARRRDQRLSTWDGGPLASRDAGEGKEPGGAGLFRQIRAAPVSFLLPGGRGWRPRASRDAGEGKGAREQGCGGFLLAGDASGASTGRRAALRVRAEEAAARAVFCREREGSPRKENCTKR